MAVNANKTKVSVYVSLTDSCACARQDIGHHRGDPKVTDSDRVVVLDEDVTGLQVPGRESQTFVSLSPPQEADSTGYVW